MALALILTLLSGQAHAGVDLAKVPAAFCKSALAVSDETSTCNTNDTFIRASEDCLDKLNALEASLGTEARAVASGGLESQLSQTGTGGREFGFSAAALGYLGAVARVAYHEVAEYPPYVFLPPDTPESVRAGNGDPYATADRAACFREPQKKIRDTLETLNRKIAMYQARLAESKRYGKTLNGRASDYGSLSGATAKGTGTGSARRVPAGQSKNGASDITGIPQDKAKAQAK